MAKKIGKLTRPKALTDIILSKPNEGWRFSVQVIEWANNPGVPVLCISRMRRKKTGEWYPVSGRAIHITKHYWANLFGEDGVIAEVMERFLDYQESASSPPP